MHQIKRQIPYIPTAQVVRLEKKINEYIKTNPLPLEKIISKDMFNTFLKNIPERNRSKYEKEGIPFGPDGIYTLKVKR